MLVCQEQSCCLSAGQLPSTWADPGSFPSLVVFFADATKLTGSLPAAWGGLGSFSSLVRLHLGSNGLTGILPPEWGSQAAFQQLTHLYIANTSITGRFSARLTLQYCPLPKLACRVLRICVTQRYADLNMAAKHQHWWDATTVCQETVWCSSPPIGYTHMRVCHQDTSQ